MGYKTLKDRRVSVTFKDYPWDHTLILQGMLAAMEAMINTTSLGKPDECVIRSPKDQKNIARTVEVLRELIDGSFSYDEEDKLYDELFDILKNDLRSWWN